MKYSCYKNILNDGEFTSLTDLFNHTNAYSIRLLQYNGLKNECTFELMKYSQEYRGEIGIGTVHTKLI